MQEHLKVSIAICTYNGAKYLQQQLDSILLQTILPDEIIICDDVSSDNSIPILQEYQRKYPARISLFLNEKNLGYTKNFEKAIGLCTGDIIFLSDQDDIWKTNKVERFLQIFSQEETVGLVYSDAEVVDENLQPLGLSIFQSRTESDLSAGRPVAEIVKNVDIKGCTFAFRSNYNPVLFPVGDCWPHDHWIALVLHAISKVYIINENLMLYRRHTHHGGDDKYLLTARNGLKQSIDNLLKPGKQLILAYEKYNNKLYAIAEHLKRMNTQYTEWILSEENLRDYLEELNFIINTRVEAYKKRIQIYKASYSKRFPLILRLLKNNTYHQHFGGYRSFFKDLIFSSLQIYSQKNNY